jgi:hypothetical protein
MCAATTVLSAIKPSSHTGGVLVHDAFLIAEGWEAPIAVSS